ncbi:uncharacterized protein LOC122366368 isoform X1 [Amphibalanus amphitrite]|uniref:uncharacterized protein LOC122366368 isoform X1 n=1 Tax=Amphibalanus amphitrite TaxID=1232801 RepID=UPI001C915D86|nr:uncharacterized protein LOC122366368 isoform X1 [Amphibalanus amphitrite]
MGHPETLPSPARRQRRLSAAADFAVTFFVATLLTTCAWKSIWILLDAAVFPNAARPSAWTSFTFGAVVVYMQTFMRDRLQLYFFCGSGGAARRLAARGVVVCLWVGVVSLWRGVFLLMDTDSGLSWFSYGMFAVAGFVVLAKLRFLNTCVALPLGVDVDLPKTFFSFESPLDTTLSDDYHLRTMDAFLSVVLTCISTFLWRGLWGFFDKIVLPGDPPVSTAISLGVGFVVCALSYAIQWPVVRWYRQLPFVPALTAHDLLALFGLTGVINVWRGVFLFFDVILPADMEPSLRLGSAAAVSVVSVLLLMLFRMSKNLLLCGVQRDLIGPLPFNCRCLSRLLQAKSLISYVAPKPTARPIPIPGQMFVHIPRDIDGKPETLI